MSFNNINNKDHGNHRRRRQQQQSSVTGTVSKIATTMMAAYGAYRVYQYYSRESEPENSEGVTDWITSVLIGENDTETREEPRASAVPTTTHTETPVSRSDLSKQRSTRMGRARLDPRTRQRLTKQQIRNCRNRVSKAFSTFWPKFQHAIEAATETNELTDELKVLRRQRLQTNAEGGESGTSKSSSLEREEGLWRDIHINTLSRWVATVYLSSLLHLSLTVQLHWVAGEVLRQGYQGDDLRDAFSSQANDLLAMTHGYALKQGLPILLAAVRRAVDQSLDDWKATTYVTLKDLKEFFRKVDLLLDWGSSASASSRISTTPNGGRRRNWIRLILPDPSMPFTVEGDDVNDEIHELMLEALWDLGESPAWEDAQQQVLGTTFSHLQEHGWGALFELVMPGATDEEGLTKYPLAQLLAPFKNACNLVEESSGGLATEPTPLMISLVARVQHLPTVLELGDVSFQEFSKDH